MPRSFITSATRRAQPELVQPYDFSIETNILVPNLGHAGFDRDAFTAFVEAKLLRGILKTAG